MASVITLEARNDKGAVIQNKLEEMMFDGAQVFEYCNEIIIFPRKQTSDISMWQCCRRD